MHGELIEYETAHGRRPALRCTVHTPHSTASGSAQPAAPVREGRPDRKTAESIP